MSQIDSHHQTSPWEASSPPVDEAEHDEDLVIRALNPDNRRDTEQLIDLFFRSYGSSYPYKQVYEESFWLNEAEDSDELISIVAIDDKRFVAHIALKPDRDRSRVEMLFSAIHPAYKKQVFKMSRLFWRCIYEQGKRHQWNVLYHYNFISHPMSQLVAAKCYRSETVALLPNYVPPHQYRATGMWRPNDRTSLLVMYNMLKDNSLHPLEIFPPTQHRKITETLYHSLGLNRQIVLNSATTGKKLNRYAQDDGIEMSCVDHFELCHLTVTPSALPNENYLVQRLGELGGDSRKKLFLHVALDDPRAPQICNLLELLGYRFCGILPLANNHDYMVYGKFEVNDLKDLTLYSPRAQSLRKYMEQIASVKSDRLH